MFSLIRITFAQDFLRFTLKLLVSSCALAWPWVELTGLGLEGWGLGLGTCGLVNIPA